MSGVVEGLNSVKADIASACNEVGRNVDDVTLIAVSKTKPIEMLMEAYNVGVRDFGENYVQELCEKIELMPKDIRWHMIGHLQRNKVKYIVGKVSMIHAVDSLRLAEEIDKCAAKLNVVQDILIEVNMGREETKFGVFEEDALSLVKEIAGLKHVRIRGLMTSAPYVVDSEENRKIFYKIKQLAVDIAGQNIDNVYMDVLSMGMSQDFVAAVKEGSTMVRVGSKIFGARDYSRK
ncbi:MAG: YggS family pyridoxal phosphate-dependent enzyme [Lachnospiraceae bacterium]|nr:YggS family pyridoxal phosphate-dependent enzyme [Lachnospiraceae bacterium]